MVPPHALDIHLHAGRLLTAGFFWWQEMLGLSSGPAGSAVKLMSWKQL